MPDPTENFNRQVIDGEIRVYRIAPTTGAQTLRELRDSAGKKITNHGLGDKSPADVEIARPRKKDNE
jgi:hypothetical protein